MALVHPGSLTYATLLKRESPGKWGTVGLGPSPSWGPMETEFVGESGTSVYDFDGIGLAHALRAQNVDRLGHSPYSYPTMVYYGLLAQAE